MRTSLCLMLCLLFLNFNTSSSTNIECDYVLLKYDIIGQLYQCTVVNKLNIYSGNSAMMHTATGQHNTGKTDDDVFAFYGKDFNAFYFPKGLTKIFKNLKVIHIYSLNIFKITQSDLKPFPKLVQFYLFNADIEILESGLFDFNTELEVICLNSNKIFHIDSNLFDSLPKLNYLLLKNNTCIDVARGGSSSEIQDIIKMTKSMCNSQEYLKLNRKLEANIDSTSLYFMNSTTVNSEINELKEELAKSAFSNSEVIKEKIDAKEQRLLKGNFQYSLSKLSSEVALMHDFSMKSDTSLKIIFREVEDNLKSSINSNEKLIYNQSETLLKMNGNVMNIENYLKQMTIDSQLTNRKIEEFQQELVKKHVEVMKMATEKQNQLIQTINQKIDVIYKNEAPPPTTTTTVPTITDSTEPQKKFEQAQNERIQKLERTFEDYMSIVLKKVEWTANNILIFQNDIRDELKAINTKINSDAEIQKYWKDILLVCCTFIVSFFMFLIWKMIMSCGSKKEEEQ